MKSGILDTSALFTRTFTDDDGTTLVRVTDQGGFIMTREEWEVLKVQVDAFYAYVPNEDIEAHNTELYKKYFPTDPTPRPKYEKVTYTPTEGFVYLIYSESGHYKIGRSINVPSRHRAIATKIPHKVHLLYYAKVTDYRAAELHLHEIFAHLRVEGEWFNLAPADADWLMNGEWIEGGSDFEVTEQFFPGRR